MCNQYFSITANSMFSLLTALFAWSLPQTQSWKMLCYIGENFCSRGAFLFPVTPKAVALPRTLGLGLELGRGGRMGLGGGIGG